MDMIYLKECVCVCVAYGVCVCVGGSVSVCVCVHENGINIAEWSRHHGGQRWQSLYCSN